ncbi:hypothetical protein [Nocardia rhizosphaerihabitans]|uniref:DUF4232 domain-containing protein n=1 Tax=Nocardia rhizosphaerihabitans TaxID=1691570 RepID=A0ABQ2KK72_9NOCA|nr:hypothetical protein [Nocardia rhizosphaerihabitans]GGN83808.1 hypothetical protein GCM10011610_36460 [Nocardia rhizosphaerihabitans]
MLEPNGPLPPEIYWRRRALAIGVIVVALAIVIWLVTMVARGGDSSGNTAAATTTTAETSSSSSAESSSTTAGSSSATATSSAPAASSAAAQPAAAPCGDQSLALKVTVGQPTYRVGDQPAFGTVITNISSAPCSRDLGPGPQFLVYTLDGQRRLWASNDCNPDGPPDMKTLGAGEQLSYKGTWFGTTSQPQCAGERLQVPAGAYMVVAQLGAIRSAAEPFNLAA